MDERCDLVNSCTVQSPSASFSDPYPRTIADTDLVVVDGDPESDSRWTALYRSGDRLVGALTLNRQNVITKYRAQIKRGGTWDAACEFAGARRQAVTTA